MHPVGMPRPITQIPAALNRRVLFTPVTSRDLAGRVAASAAFRKAPTNPGAPAPKAPTPIPFAHSFRLRPIEFLKNLGIAMLPPRHAAQNLASWHWTLLRYAYLIEPEPGRPFATNELVGDYRHHHMTALSEAFGIGWALSYARSWLAAQAPAGAVIRNPIDLDYVLLGAPVTGHVAAPMVHQAANASRHPDFLIAAEHSNTIRLLLVECKGNSGGGSSKSIGQLGSAMHQLEGIHFENAAGEPVAVDKHAYASRMTKAGGALEILGVDPVPEGRRWVRPDRVQSDSPRPIEAQAEAPRRMSAEKTAGRLLRRLDDAIQTWSGLEGIGTETNLQQLKRRESDFGDIAGTASTLELPNGTRVEVFTGAVVDALEASREGDFERAEARRAGLRNELRGAPRPQWDAEVVTEESQLAAAPLKAAEDPERASSVVTEDGSVLSIEVR
jgi:hypothetical protein